MLLIFTSGLSSLSQQAKLLSDRLAKRGAHHLVVDAHDLANSNLALVQSGHQVKICFENVMVTPSCVYLMHQWRTDAIIRIPQGVSTPNVYRMQSFQFLQDMRFSMEHVRWVPGHILSIERADSKPTLLARAYARGLAVPTMTYDAVFDSDLVQADHYRKNMGPPFVVSYDNQEREETSVTITGVLQSDPDAVMEPGLYQWQVPLRAQWQVRMFVVGNWVWAVRLAREGLLEDLRERTQGQQQLPWQPYEMPRKIVKRVIALMHELHLSIAAPEFLVVDNQHVFIDLNPCGDWLGFFNESTTDQIIEVLCAHLTTAVS